MATKLFYGSDDPEVKGLLQSKQFATIYIGEKAAVSALKPDTVNVDIAPIRTGSVETMQTWSDGFPTTIASIPSERSRHNACIRVDAIQEVLQKALTKEYSTKVCILVQSTSQIVAAAAAVARSFPIFSKKASFLKQKKRSVWVDFKLAAEPNFSAENIKDIDYNALQIRAENIQLAAELVDTTPDILTTDAYVERVQKIVEALPAKIKDRIKITIIRDRELEAKGFGGLWGVGKGASFPPALVHLAWEPERNEQKDVIALIGKGILYDSGGLSLKTPAFMPTMKQDMGGSAAIFGAFLVAVKSNYNGKLHAVLCMAENAIGPAAYKPDDILTSYSGKTIEILNTDAEGRLVLADGVAYASKHLNPTIVIDVATLTGAQAIATGQKHAAILCNDEDLERKAVKAGVHAGEPAHPLVYCPEFFMKEFQSEVADMKNSVKERSNGQSSCAGHFIEEHLVDYKGKWLHVDMAAPAMHGGRGTGFGVGLLVSLLFPNGNGK